MAQPFVGQIISVGFNFAPVGWFMCDGSLKPISEFTVLYQLLGTTYGGDGVSTFAVPDLRGRAPMHAGQAPGRPAYIQGQMLGDETITLLSGQVASHSHTLLASTQVGTANTPGPSLALAQNAQAAFEMYGTIAPDTALLPASISPPPSSGQPHENRQPYQVINYIIAWSGVFPSQQ